MAAQLHLAIEPPEVVVLAAVIPCQVAAAVPGHCLVVGDKALGRKLGPVQVARAGARSGDPHLAGCARLHRGSMLISQRQPQRRYGKPDGRGTRLAAGLGSGELAERDVDRGLGDAVHVDDPDVGRAPRGQEAGDVGQADRLAAQDQRPELGEHAVPPDQRRGQIGEQRGRRGQTGDLMRVQAGAQPVRVPDDLRVREPARSAVQPRTPHLPHAEVEGERVQHGRDVVVRRLEQVAGGVEEAQYVAMSYDASLRHSGRAGCVQNINRVGVDPLNPGGGIAAMNDGLTAGSVDMNGCRQVIEHKAQPALRIRGIDRCIGNAGQNRTENRGDARPRS